MAQAAVSNFSSNDQQSETSSITLAPVHGSDAVPEVEVLSPVHKRPKDDTSNFVRPQNTDAASTEESKPESGSDDSLSDEKTSAENAPSAHALTKLVESHSLKAIQFPVGVFVRIRPLVGKEVEADHSTIHYAVKTLKKSNTQKLTIKKAPDDANGDEKKGDDTEQLDEAQKKMLAMKRRLGQKGRDVDYKGFRRILLPDSDNVAVFETAIAPFVSNVMLGQKTCIFAYGHTGSGKTHTIFGYRPHHQGMFELFAQKLLSELAEVKGVGVEIHFTELYNRKVYDLLSEDQRQCYIRESDGEFRLRADPVQGDDGKWRAYPVTGIIVRDVDALLKVIAKGVGSRKCGESTLHDKSSRSHAFLEFEVVSKRLVEHRKKLVEHEADFLDKQNNMKENMYVTPQRLEKMKVKLAKMRAKEKRMCNDPKRPYIGGVINFVDLAGNEYARDAAAAEDKQQQKERGEINKSLLALKECIRALNGKKKFVGFRNSELTKYMKKYLTGKDAHAVMLAHLGPSRQYEKQSKNTLQYAELIANAAK